MYNKKSVTFEALNDYFKNYNGEINKEHLINMIYNQFDITYRHTNGGNGKSKLFYILRDETKKNIDLVKIAFLDFANFAIEQLDLKYRYKATAEHLEEYLKNYGLTWEVFNPVMEELDEMRKSRDPVFEQL